MSTPPDDPDEALVPSRGHLKAIFAFGELDPKAVVNQTLTTALDGKTYSVSQYNLEAVLAVGYRVRSSCCPMS